MTEKLELLCRWEWTGVKAESVASCENVGSVFAGDAKADGVKSFGEASADMKQTKNNTMCTVHPFCNHGN